MGKSYIYICFCCWQQERTHENTENEKLEWYIQSMMNIEQSSGKKTTEKPNTKIKFQKCSTDSRFVSFGLDLILTFDKLHANHDYLLKFAEMLTVNTHTNIRIQTLTHSHNSRTILAMPKFKTIKGHLSRKSIRSKCKWSTQPYCSIRFFDISQSWNYSETPWIQNWLPFSFRLLWCI